MNKRVCDVCGKNEATSSYKVMRSVFQTCRSGNRKPPAWSTYEKIDICEKCSETILGFTTRIKPPAHK